MTATKNDKCGSTSCDSKINIDSLKSKNFLKNY